MIRTRLEDAAIAAAKGQSHAEVEVRHVLFAIAREFRERPEAQRLLALTRNALEPAGTALGVPRMTTAAAALLASLSTEEDAVEALVATLDGGTKGSEQVGTSSAPLEHAVRSQQQPGKPGVPPAPQPAESTTHVLSELENLIGLASVKAQVRAILAVVQANRQRAEAGLPTVTPGLHMVFTGPPGTGKTTVARLVARLYASTGVLSGSKFTEATRADIVAGYVGQTAIRTTELVQKAKPGVLFIDEAYSLTPKHESDYGAEAIATLVKAMEEYRNEFAVIAAGYGQEMLEFVSSNPGLRSRFKTFVDFPNYDADELTNIFEGFARESSIALQAGVADRARAIFARALVEPDFGNARFARSLFERAYARMASRAIADGVVNLDELTGLAVEDIEWRRDDLDREGRRIGFE